MAYLDNFQRVNNPFVGVNALWPSLNIQPKKTVGAGTVSYAPQFYKREAFTPNAFTQAQLQGMNNMQTPQWMMDAYSSKIGRMGGNANQPPFGVTQSGFPGIAGKSAPSQGG